MITGSVRATLERGTTPPQWGLPGGRIHAHYSLRQIGRGTVILTAMCGQVAIADDVAPHAIGPTCRRCKAQTRGAIR
jgi:hypothetical protein